LLTSKRQPHDFSHLAGDGIIASSRTLKALEGIRKTQKPTCRWQLSRWPLERLLERWIGVSFRTFFTGLVPANPNDVYYNGRCAFCWRYYDDHHRGVRLPCNHIFGADCLIELFQSGNVQICPICRTEWFPDRSMGAMARRCVSTLWTRLVHPSLPMTLKIHSIWLQFQSRYPYTFLVLFMFYVLCNDNFYYLASFLVDKQTNLRDRNPDMDLYGRQLFSSSSVLCICSTHYA
jgi:hypothetical protein